MTVCICNQHLAPLRTIQDVRRRCAVSEEILGSCELIERGDWRLLERCRECGRIWVVEYPFSEQHGGGPLCAYHVEQARFPTNHLTLEIRGLDEDRAFLRQLGPQVGPEVCRVAACGRLRIHNSIFCAHHHVESIKGYSPG